MFEKITGFFHSRDNRLEIIIQQIKSPASLATSEALPTECQYRLSSSQSVINAIAVIATVPFFCSALIFLFLMGATRLI